MTHLSADYQELDVALEPGAHGVWLREAEEEGFGGQDGGNVGHVAAYDPLEPVTIHDLQSHSHGHILVRFVLS